MKIIFVITIFFFLWLETCRITGLSTHNPIFESITSFAVPPNTFASNVLYDSNTQLFYGVAGSGCSSNSYGCIYSMTSEGLITILHSFSGHADGVNPNGLVSDGAGNYYGATNAGGPGDKGTIYRYNIISGFSLIYIMTGNDGYNAYGALVSDGAQTYYGVTQSGGAIGDGVIFSITTQGVYLPVHNFDFAECISPNSLTADGNGNYYGTCQQSGPKNGGILFRITPSVTDSFTILHSFDGNSASPTGAFPNALISADSGSILYGTCSGGGVNTFGAVFRYTPADGNFTILHSFTGSDGKYPYAGLVSDGLGNYLGTTGYGGINVGLGYGGIFRITTDGTFTALHNFTGFPNEDGAAAVTLLTQGLGGYFYGFTAAGGSANSGVAYKFSPTTRDYAVLIQITVTTEGYAPYGIVSDDKEGNHYGTNGYGGKYGYGVIFKVTPTGSVTALHSFTNINDDGAYPLSGVIGDGNNNFYGTTVNGGLGGKGVVFKITSEGFYTTLYSFPTGGADGLTPYGLVGDGLGNYYGTALDGGVYNKGTIYKITSNGNFTLLHSFNDPDGVNPFNSLTYDSVHQVLIGTTSSSGANNTGLIFRFNLNDNTLTKLYSFTGNEDGGSPSGPLISDGAGSFLGIAPEAGDENAYCGVIYKITYDGQYSTVYTFKGLDDGCYPYTESGLARDKSGLYYGTTNYGGAYDQGVIFRFNSTNNQFAVIYTFTGNSDSGTPQTIANNGYGIIYGTTTGRNNGAFGSIFRLDPPSVVLNLSIPLNTTGFTGSVSVTPYSAKNNPTVTGSCSYSIDSGLYTASSPVNTISATNSSNLYLCTFPLLTNLSNGLHIITVSYSGDNNYDSTSVSTNFVISGARTSSTGPGPDDNGINSAFKSNGFYSSIFISTIMLIAMKFFL